MEGERVRSGVRIDWTSIPVLDAHRTPATGGVAIAFRVKHSEGFALSLYRPAASAICYRFAYVSIEPSVTLVSFFLLVLGIYSFVASFQDPNLTGG